MGLVIRLWHTINNQVSPRCWNSKCLSHIKADDILAKFNDSVSTADLNKMIQVSMDGPNTNWKYVKYLKRCWLENEQHQLMDIGSCSLQIIHGAFKTGTENTNWELKKVLKGPFTLLHDPPARRDDCVSLTGSSTFPLFFCATRLIKNLLIDWSAYGKK